MAHFRIIQLSDCHLQAEPEQRFNGINPEACLLAVLADINQRNWLADLLLLTGDLVHAGQAAGYQRLHQYVEPIAPAWRWLPGNHDAAQLMGTFSHPAPAWYQSPYWTLLTLDSTANPDGKGAGSLTEASLAALEQAQTLPPRYLCVALHHPPMPVGSPWQDAIALTDAGRFWQRIARLPTTRLILCGHLHQEHQRNETAVPVLTTPATGFQYRPGTNQPELETAPPYSWPGYRVIDLLPSGGYRTEVIRVPV